MPSKSLFWLIYPYYLAMTFLSILLMFFYSMYCFQPLMPPVASFSTYSPVIVLGATIFASLAIIGFLVLRHLTFRLKQMKEGAERIAQGNLDTRLPISHYEEIGGLAIAMNTLASQLNERIRTVSMQHNEHEAVLASMAEGVLAIDRQHRIISINQAAARLFAITQGEARGKYVHEVLPNQQLLGIIESVLDNNESVECDIVLRDRSERIVQTQATILQEAEGQNIGALIVMNDVTRLRRLEEIRRDFVANVSHELKTPITSIKGFIETLLDGAMENPEERKRFLQIVAKQADRLNAIIEDTLCLSRLEQGAEIEQMEFTRTPLAQVLKNAIQTCEMQATEKNIQIGLKCENNLATKINPQLLEQAMINLIDNAIKYSHPGKTVQVECYNSRKNIFIHVHDEGCGIPEEHLSRIFERFYRVDKARSRKVGGTGLGLAIVKHIVLAHRGEVKVESKFGKGSTFTISLPNA